MGLIKSTGEYNDFPVPPVLYKYREWDNPLHQTILKDRILYLSSPKGFTDVHDCKVPVRFDLLSDKEILKRSFNRSKSLNPTYSRQQHRKYARECLKKSPLRNPEEYKKLDKEFRDRFDREFGVLSLTPNPANYQMWEEYADSHKGFCVGYGGRELMSEHDKFGGIGYVDYEDELPIITPDTEYLDRAVINVFSKLKEYSFEEEFRSIKIMPDSVNDKWRKAEVRPEYFTEIIFGANMPEEHKKEIIEIAQKNMPHIKFKQAYINPVNKEVAIRDLTV